MRDVDLMRLPAAVPAIGAVCGIVHAASHGWWTATGPPPFVRAESVFVAGWPLVSAAAVAASICAGIGVVDRWPPAARWLWCGVGWLAAVALAGYGMLLWPGLAQLLMAPFGESIGTDDLGALLLRALGTATAITTVVCIRPVVRRLRDACADCGRLPGRSPRSRRDPTGRWGYLGGYLAILGLAVRLAPATPGWARGDVLGSDPPGGAAFLLFVGLMMLAGTLLPLALVHRWGRIWPRWVLPWAGRDVPRWVVLGPGLMMSVGLLAYFGAGGTTALLLGKTSGSPAEAVEIAGYVLWGAGLAIASTSYARLTRPGCDRCAIEPGEPQDIRTRGSTRA